MRTFKEGYSKGRREATPWLQSGETNMKFQVVQSGTLIMCMMELPFTYGSVAHEKLEKYGGPVGVSYIEFTMEQLDRFVHQEKVTKDSPLYSVIAIMRHYNNAGLTVTLQMHKEQHVEDTLDTNPVSFFKQFSDSINSGSYDSLNFEVVKQGFKDEYLSGNLTADEYDDLLKALFKRFYGTPF